MVGREKFTGSDARRQRWTKFNYFITRARIPENKHRRVGEVINEEWRIVYSSLFIDPSSPKIQIDFAWTDDS